MFISSLIKMFTGMGNICNQNLNFIVKIIRNQTVFRTIKKKVNFVFYLVGSTKRAAPIISGSLIVSTKFYQFVVNNFFLSITPPGSNKTTTLSLRHGAWGKN